MSVAVGAAAARAIMKKNYVRPLDLACGAVDLSHGGGGRAMLQLISEVFGRAFDNEWLRRGDDGAVLPAPAAGERLVIATDATYPPFEMVDSSGKLGGFEVDLAYALCAAMKTECEVINQPWDALLPGLQVRKYDAIMSSMNITDERRQKVAFSQVYYMMQNRFVGRSDKAADFADTPEHFKGKVIAVQEGTPQDNFITARYGDVAKIKRYVNAQSPMLDLQSSRADYTFGNMVQLKVGFLDKEMGKQFAFVGPQFNGTQDKILGEGVAVALRKKDDKLKSQFDAAIESVKADGTFDQLLKKYQLEDLL